MGIFQSRRNREDAILNRDQLTIEDIEEILTGGPFSPKQVKRKNYKIAKYNFHSQSTCYICLDDFSLGDTIVQCRRCPSLLHWNCVERGRVQTCVICQFNL